MGITRFCRWSSGPIFKKRVTTPFSCSALNSAHNLFNLQAFMAILEILQYPDPRLNTPAEKVEKLDAATRKLIDDMAETMYAPPAAGLAANQVDVHKQIILIALT